MKLYLLIIFFTLSIQVNAQKAKFSVNPSHVAFYGYNNPIQVEHPGKTRLYAIDTNYCKTFQKNAQFYIRPTYKFGNDSCKIVARTTDKKVLHVDTLTVYVKTFESGKASIGEVNGYISKEKLMEADSMELVTPYLIAGSPSFRIVKYRMLIIPKVGWLEEISIVGNKIPKVIKTKFNSLKPGDMLVFDGIRAKSEIFGIEKPIAPFAVTISARNYNALTSNFRIEGFIKNSDGKTQAYIFPLKLDDKLLENVIKDSLWKYYRYDYIEDTFQLESEEFFKNAHTAYRVVYNRDSINGYYKLTTIPEGGDSIYMFEQYYLSGQLYQKGLMLTNTVYSEYRHFKFSNETSRRELPLHKLALSRVPEEFYPTAYWQVYYPTGELQISLDWTVRQDTSYNSGCSFSDAPIDPINKKYYYLLPKNDVLIYNREGQITERLFPEE